MLRSAAFARICAGEVEGMWVLSMMKPTQLWGRDVAECSARFNTKSEPRLVPRLAVIES